jgi:transcription antitermination factor NusG
MNDWHVWTISSQKYKKVENFLKTAPGVINYLYPMVEREYETKAGKRTKGVPPYNNYIFIEYDNDNGTQAYVDRCEWIKDYIGICSRSEMKQVKRVANQNYEDIMPMSEIKVGSRYKLKGTPFKGWDCKVVAVDGDKLTVSVEIFRGEHVVKCSREDINLEG